MEPEPSAPAPIGTSEMGSITPCPAPSVAEGAEALSTSTTSESAALRITIPSSDSSRRKQWKARPTAIQPPANPSKLSAPLPTRRPRGRPMGSTTKRKDAPIASRKVVSRVNAVASSSAVTLDALDGPQPAWRIISPAPRESGAPDPSASEPLGPSASGPLDPAALPSARRRTDLHKRKAEPVPTDDAPRKRRREGPAATSTASEDGPRWLPPRLGPTRTMPSAQDGLTCAAELRPRIWASNKADLHAVLPELFGTKPTSTPISTMVDYMPVIVLDEERIQVSVDQGSPLCCKLTISRKFSCDGAALPHLAPDGLEMATLPRIPLTPCTERHSEPESMTETIQANDARSSLPSGAEHASEHLTAVPTQLEIQESQGAPEAETVHGLAVPEDPLTEGDELKYPPSMTTKLPIVPLVYASEILTALWHHALSDFQPLDARVLDEVTPGGDLAVAQIENPPCQMEKTSIPEMQLPKYLPPDIAALQEAWIQQYPVLLVASRATLATCWHVLVPEEYAYCFLGLFHLAEMQDKIARGPDGEPFTAVDRGGRTNGSVQWTMTLRWVGGGERFLGNEDLRRPWWVPDQLPTHAPTPTTVDDSSELPSATSTSQQLGPSTTGADDPPSDSMAAMARTWLSYLSPAAMSVFPGDRDPDPSISEDDRGVYPVSFVPRVGHCLSDETFPSGWCCRRCGRINLQLCMRRRACASAACATVCTELKEEAAASPDFEPADQKPTYVGYALRLDDVRDPRDTLPLAQPVSVYPSGVQSFMAEAEDGMRIVEVRESRQMPVKELGSAMPSALAEAITSEKDEPTVVDDPMDIYESASRVGTLLATHIFTCNMRSLQSNADQLFLDVQRYADLRRSRVSDNIFRCELSVAPVSSEGGQQTMSNEEKVTTTESLARRLHNHLIDRAYEYTDEETNFPIRRLFCIAGIGAGSRKLADTLNATKHPVVVLCLGCDARLTITNSRLVPMKGKYCPVKDSFRIRAEDEDGDNQDAEEEQPSGTKGKAAETGKKATDTGKKATDLSVGMVHGDVLVLTNDVYQISFKRTGTSILVVGLP